MYTFHWMDTWTLGTLLHRHMARNANDRPINIWHTPRFVVARRGYFQRVALKHAESANSSERNTDESKPKNSLTEKL